MADLVSAFLSGSTANVGAVGRRAAGGSAGLTTVAPRGGPLDVANCELVIDGKRIPLTRLELGVLQYLEGHQVAWSNGTSSSSTCGTNSTLGAM